jgi:hypothetical protein
MAEVSPPRPAGIGNGAAEPSVSLDGAADVGLSSSGESEVEVRVHLRLLSVRFTWTGG